jgi:uncharacterized membrane protein
MSAAADNTTATSSSSAAAAFQIPGKKISVLPIGLGIFAGISVIALIVVGLVTYERTKYRKVRCTHHLSISHTHMNPVTDIQTAQIGRAGLSDGL